MNISRYAHQTVLDVPLPRLRSKEAIRLTGLLYDLAATLEDYYRDAIAEREELKEQAAKVGSSRRATVTRPWRRGSGSAAPWSTLKRRSINRIGSRVAAYPAGTVGALSATRVVAAQSARNTEDFNRLARPGGLNPPAFGRFCLLATVRPDSLQPKCGRIRRKRKRFPRGLAGRPCALYNATVMVPQWLEVQCLRH